MKNLQNAGNNPVFLNPPVERKNIEGLPGVLCRPKIGKITTSPGDLSPNR
jgi:hypothetical protein